MTNIRVTDPVGRNSLPGQAAIFPPIKRPKASQMDVDNAKSRKYYWLLASLVQFPFFQKLFSSRVLHSSISLYTRELQHPRRPSSEIFAPGYPFFIRIKQSC